MAELKEEKPLTQEEKNAIWSAIYEKMASDDRYPYEVIEEDYKGDEEAYLRVMARWHNVPIGPASKND